MIQVVFKLNSVRREFLPAERKSLKGIVKDMSQLDDVLTGYGCAVGCMSPLLL
jgi:hypothetical protein